MFIMFYFLVILIHNKIYTVFFLSIQKLVYRKLICIHKYKLQINNMYKFYNFFNWWWEIVSSRDLGYGWPTLNNRYKWERGRRRMWLLRPSLFCRFLEYIFELELKIAFNNDQNLKNTFLTKKGKITIKLLYLLILIYKILCLKSYILMRIIKSYI